jgi:potassium-transporting ATPase potassium-binding subunit
MSVPSWLEILCFRGLLAYTLVGGLLTYGGLRLQAHLPRNPNGYADVRAGLSFNTAMSCMTDTNWQNYSGENTMSVLSQMLGLVWHQLISAASACAGRRVHPQPGPPRRNTLGNFWVDTTAVDKLVVCPPADSVPVC